MQEPNFGCYLMRAARGQLLCFSVRCVCVNVFKVDTRKERQVCCCSVCDCCAVMIW